MKDTNKKPRFLRAVGIEDSDFDAIAQSVKEAEKHTDGEIALAITRQSDDYSIYELLLGSIIAFIVFFVSLFFVDELEQFLGSLLWYPASWNLIAFIGSIIFLSMLIFFAIANIPSVDRLIIPNAVKQQKVFDRTLIHFLESGVYKTKHHSGILIFISVLERKVIVLGDEGINAKIKPEQWSEICNSIALGIKNKQAGKALCDAVEACGKLLAENFPEKKENPNELPDGLVIV